MTESPFVDSGFAVPVFSPGDDLIACLNKAMAFLMLCSFLKDQATIQMAKVNRATTQVQRRQGQNYSGTNTYKGNATSSRGNTTSGQARVVKCYNCQREGHMARQCTQPKRTRNATWYKEKAMLAEAHEAGQILDEEQLAFLAEVPNSETYLNDMDNQSVHALQDFEQHRIMYFYTDNIYQLKAISFRILNICYQNPFYLKKAQRIKPTLYDGCVISEKHDAMHVVDDEETLILEEESRSKMSEKAKDPKAIKQNISHKPIDYENTNPSIEPSYLPPVIVDVPSELPKVSLVNASLKKLKFHLTQFDSMVRKRTTPSALKEGEWGFEHTKTVFNNEIISFLKSLKDIFNVFDKDLLNEITEVQTVFDQMDAVVQQSSVNKQCLEIAKKEILLENDRLLQKIMSQDVMLTVMNSMSLNNNFVNMKMQKCDSCEKCLNLDAELSKSKQAYNDFLKNYSQLEKHCISLEASMQLQQEVFQNDESCVNQNAVEIQKYFEINDLKARLQDKDTTICKLKDTIKSLSKNTKEENVNPDKCDLEPINKELENSVAKLLSENERLCNEINHVKQVFKDQFDSIKQTRVRHKEQCDSLINKLNLKSVENEDLKAQIQDKVFVITSLKNDLQKLKGKEIVENVVHTPSATTIAPGMFKLDLEPLPPSELDLACKYATRIQELLVYVQDTCPNAITPSAKKVTIKPMNNVKKVGFAETSTPSSKIQQVESSNTSDSNTPVLSSTGVKCSTSNCGSKPPGNKKNDRISQTPSRNKKNKVEAQPRKVNKVNRVVKPVCDVDVKYSLSNANSVILCATCNKYMFNGVHDKCLLDLVQNRNKRTKSAKKHKKQNILETYDHGPRYTNLYTIILDDMLKHLRSVFYPKRQRLRAGYGTVDYLISTSTLREWYENVGITHQTSVARTPQQNGVVERQNWTLVEVARTMLIFSKAPLFLWAEAINTACYTQNRSLIRLRYNKTPYELMQDKKPDLSFFHVFGSLCYPTNDHEDLGKFYAKADIGIYVGYAPAKKAFRIYTRRTRSGPGLHYTTPATSNTGLGLNPISQQPCIPPNRDDWDRLFQPMFNEYFNPSTIVVSPVQEAVASRAEVLADSPMSTSIDQDAPSTSIPSSQEHEQSPIISQGFEESPKIPTFHDDPLIKSPHEDSTSQGSSSNVRQLHTLFKHLGRWTKDHPIANGSVILLALYLQESNSKLMTCGVILMRSLL
ncbi:integrase, catalytic region, zinc finger, CCHC-type containing protein [Tanacetum coccineum]